MSTFLKSFVLGFGLCIFQLVSCSCEKEPTKPPDFPPEEHLFYVGSYYDGHIKVFSVEQKKFVDSFYFPAAQGVRVDVIGKDEKLAVTADEVQIFDLKTRQTVQTYPDAVEAWVSPDSRYIALGNSWSDPYSYMLELRELESGNLIYTDSMVRMLRFSADSKLVGYVHLTQDPTRTEMVIYDIRRDSLLEEGLKYFNDAELFIYFPLPLASREKVVFLGSGDVLDRLYVMNFGSDTARILHSLSPGYIGAYAVDYTEDKVYATTNPGWNMLPNKRIYVYDIISGQLADSILTDSSYHEPDQLSISWDNKYLVTGSAPLGSFSIGLTDLVNRVYLGSFEISEDPDSLWIPSWVSTRGQK